MRCVKCGRALGPKPAATVQTAQGLSAWGPVCARRAGLIAAKPRQRAIQLRALSRPQQEETEDQLPLEFAA